MDAVADELIGLVADVALHDLSRDLVDAELIGRHRARNDRCAETPRGFDEYQRRIAIRWVQGHGYPTDLRVHHSLHDNGHVNVRQISNETIMPVDCRTRTVQAGPAVSHAVEHGLGSDD